MLILYFWCSIWCLFRRLQVLETELTNDSTYETFNMSAIVKGKPVPCMYVKLAPLLCWGPSYNLSIWYVELSGNDDPEVVRPYLQWYREVGFFIPLKKLLFFF